MRITDDMIISIVRELGPISSKEITREIVRRNPSEDRNYIYGNTARKTRQLEKYRYFKAVVHNSIIYYYMDGQTMIFKPEAPPGSPTREIREYIQNLPEGTTITYAQVCRKFGVCRDAAYRALKPLSFLKMKQTSPRVFIKGAIQ